MLLSPTSTEITHFHLFCGLGGGALGFNQGHARIGTAEATFRCLGGIDSNPASIRDFNRLVGVPGTVMDLFDREQYVAFHGREPGPEWREATPADVRRAAGDVTPDIIFTSPPCKGFSGLLNGASARSLKYQALNALVTRSLFLTLEAWKDDPVPFLLIENVPRIQTRGRHLLDMVQGLLRAYGYATAETVHDCGELGGLGQHRKRFLLVARHSEKIPPFLYEPPKRRVRSVGEVLDALPMPDADAGGIMHRSPKLKWRTWLRLALIEAGSDWRSLEKLAVQDGYLSDIGLVPEGWGDYHAYGVKRWTDTAETVTSKAAAGSGAFNVADPRATTGWTGKAKYRVTAYDEPAGTVIAASTTGTGATAVADPRLRRGTKDGANAPFSNVYRVVRWDEVGMAVTGGTSPSAGGVAVADPRPGWAQRKRSTGDFASSGHLGVVAWDEAVGAVVGHAKWDRGAFSVADHRLPEPDSRCSPLIISLDGTWHRPFTTLELAALQGFPVIHDGEALVLDGRNMEDWRERIGNAVPAPTATAIANTMGETFLLARAGVTFQLSASPIWVRERDHRLALALSIPAYHEAM